MSRAEFSDGDAMAAALDEHRAKHQAEQAKRAARRVMMPAGDLAALLFALDESTAFAQRQSNTKEFRVRTDAVNIVARNKPLIEKLRKKIPEYVTPREGS